jgi:hypothetical protein
MEHGEIADRIARLQRSEIGQHQAAAHRTPS